MPACDSDRGLSSWTTTTSTRVCAAWSAMPRSPGATRSSSCVWSACWDIWFTAWTTGLELRQDQQWFELCELVSEAQLCCLELCVCQCQGWTCCCAGGASSSQMTGCATQFATWLDMSWVSFHDSWKTLMSHSISKKYLQLIKKRLYSRSRRAWCLAFVFPVRMHGIFFVFFGPIELNQFVAFVSFVSIVSFTAGILSVGMRGHQWGWTMSACSNYCKKQWMVFDRQRNQGLVFVSSLCAHAIVFKQEWSNDSLRRSLQVDGPCEQPQPSAHKHHGYAKRKLKKVNANPSARWSCCRSRWNTVMAADASCLTCCSKLFGRQIIDEAWWDGLS